MENNQDKIFVKKDEIKETWNSLEQTLKNINQLISNIHKYSSWATNVSIAILGFILAILMQLKSQNAIFDIHIILSIFICLGFSIAIGFYLKIKYEISIFYQSVKNIWQNTVNIINDISNKFIEKGANADEINKGIEGLKELKLKESKFDSPSKNIPLKLIYSQLIIVIVSIILTAHYVIQYLFFK